MTPEVDAPVRPAEAPSAPVEEQPPVPVAEIFPDLEIAHGHTPREATRAARGSLGGHDDPGKFGRMFPDLDPLIAPDDALFALAQAMKDDDAAGKGGDNPAIPAAIPISASSSTTT